MIMTRPTSVARDSAIGAASERTRTSPWPLLGPQHESQMKTNGRHPGDVEDEHCPRRIKICLGRLSAPEVRLTTRSESAFPVWGVVVKRA
jgi:hypothetical protein